jgi:pimeloyl-ACP methyl ester carboxylesterase
VPTQIVWGEQDRVLPVAYGAAWRRAIIGARLVIVAGAGHLPHVEKPAETAGTITDFIAQPRAAT